MDTTERFIDGEVIYKGRIVTLRSDTVRLCTGGTAKREVVEHCDGVAVLPIDENGDCYFVSQFRYPFGRMILEAPAGKVEPGEDHSACAVRELSEETGFTAESMRYLGSALPSPGYATEVLHIYLATGLHQGETHPDEDEFMDVVKLGLSEAVDKVMNGEITDAKTVIAILKAEKFFESTL